LVVVNIAQKTNCAFFKAFQIDNTLKMKRFVIYLKNKSAIYFCAVLNHNSIRNDQASLFSKSSRTFTSCVFLHHENPGRRNGGRPQTVRRGGENAKERI
jgi:hypothetical protein